MGYRRDDGTFNDVCLDRVKLGEPIFVLRAQDRIADELVEIWARKAELIGCDPVKVQEARDCAQAMRRWTPRKYPD